MRLALPPAGSSVKQRRHREAAPRLLPVRWKKGRMSEYASLPDALSPWRADITLARRETWEYCDDPGRRAGRTHPPLADPRALRGTVRVWAGLYRPGHVSTHARVLARCAARSRGVPCGHLGQWADRAGLCRNAAPRPSWGECAGRGGCAGDRRDGPGTGGRAAAHRRPTRASHNKQAAWCAALVGAWWSRGVRAPLADPDGRSAVDKFGLCRTARLGWHELLVGTHAAPGRVAAAARLASRTLVEPARRN